MAEPTSKDAIVVLEASVTHDDPGEIVRSNVSFVNALLDEYLTADVAVTIYEKLGIPSDLMAQAPDGRPVRLLEGHPIHEWM